MTNREHFYDFPSDESLRRLAEMADVTVWSVQRRLLSLPVKGRIGLRIDRVLDAEALP